LESHLEPRQSFRLTLIPAGNAYLLLNKLPAIFTTFLRLTRVHLNRG